MHPIAYIAGLFPNATETFVYREVLALRERGWNVFTISLHDTPSWDDPRLQELRRQTSTLYGTGMAKTLAGALLELLRHPLRTIGTVVLSIRDAVCPGELMRPRDRLKLPAQAVAGIGLSRRLRQCGVRHIHCHFAHAPSTVGMYAARQLDVPFSFTGHANDLFQRRALLVRKIERAAFVSCISRWHESFYRAAAPGANANYRVIRCGIDVAGWTPPNIPPAATDNSPLRILTVCRLVEKKGVDTLIRALAGLRELDWQLTIAGDGPELPRLQKLAQDLRCPQRIRWLGLVTNEHVHELMSSADVFALPCRTDSSGDRDGIPVVLIEAMACGLPVLSGDLPAIRELIDDNVNGILVSSADENQAVARLAAAFSQLATHPQDRLSLGHAARQCVLDEFSLDASITLLEAALRESMVRQDATATLCYKMLHI